MDSAFLNLARGNRLATYMGLEMGSGVPVKYSKDYTYVEVPIKCLENADGGHGEKAMRNQHLLVIPNCKVDVRGTFKVLVKTNPELQKVASCPSLFILDALEHEQCSFYATFRKDFDINELDWVVRLYLLG